MPSLIDVSALRKSFGQTLAVGGVSFSAGRGEVVGFLGPNGAGKTTTMRMIAGYLTPDSGSTTIDGIDVGRDPVAAKAKIGYLPEGAPLYGDMTTRAFLDFIAEARRLPRGSRAQAIDKVIDRLALEPVMSRRIDTLSKGFRRRVGIAQAILHDPPVLILDEPTDGLDPNQKHEMRALIDEMAATKAIVISTHVLEEVDAVCSRAIIIDAGQIRFDGTPAALRQRSTYHNAVVVTLTGEAATLAEIALRKSSHIASVTRIVLGGNTTELLLRAKGNKPIVAEIESILAKSGIVPETIAVERGRLDEVFRDLTTAAHPGGIDTETEA